MTGSLFINGQWQAGRGEGMQSADPATGDEIWTGRAASDDDVDLAFKSARDAFQTWSQLSAAERRPFFDRLKAAALDEKDALGLLIAQETGKVLWDAVGEAGAVAAKGDISWESYDARTGQMSRDTAFGQASLQHRAHGVMAVLGPYNFPAHLPNGQIIPALIAGNTVVFKPSEQTPAVGEKLVKLFETAGFPPGVINLVQGARDTGAAVLGHEDLDGVLFTGSAKTGAYIHKLFGGRPEIILALEMGGNNPLIVWDVEDAAAAASQIVQSAFITSGQRCTCARRLILPTGEAGEAVLNAVIALMKNMSLGDWRDGDAATIGPVVSETIANFVRQSAQDLTKHGAKTIMEAGSSDKGPAFVTPGLYDVTGCDVPDEEIFGPVLQVQRVENWDAAIAAANNTKFGLSAGLISDDEALWADFKTRIRAGVVNFNRPTTGAAGFLPFGGPGASGNHNPGAFYAADFCAWPMASQIAPKPEYLPMKGLKS